MCDSALFLIEAISFSTQVLWSYCPCETGQTLNLAFYSIESTEAACLSSLHKTVSVEDAGARLV